MSKFDNYVVGNVKQFIFYFLAFIPLDFLSRNYLMANMWEKSHFNFGGKFEFRSAVLHLVLQILLGTLFDNFEDFVKDGLGYGFCLDFSQVLEQSVLTVNLVKSSAKTQWISLVLLILT